MKKFGKRLLISILACVAVLGHAACKNSGETDGSLTSESGISQESQKDATESNVESVSVAESASADSVTSAESTESSESMESVESAESAESTESMESVESTDSSESSEDGSAKEETGYDEKGFAYILSADGKHYIFSGNKTTAEGVDVPAEFNGKPVREIADNAFDSCINLKTVRISDGVTKIGTNAFRGCTKVEKITLGKGVETIAGDAFYGCTGLMGFEVAEGNENYTVIGGHLYSDGGKTLVRYAVGKGETTFTILPAVTTIGSCAFAQAGLGEITVPASVSKIESRAFENAEVVSIVFEGDTSWEIKDGKTLETKLTLDMKESVVPTVTEWLTSVAPDSNGHIYSRMVWERVKSNN